MASALIYCQSGGGKTVNSVQALVSEGKKNKLICTDNSSVVLRNFPEIETYVEVQNIREVADMAADSSGKMLLDREIESGKYSNIIIDNLSDYFDLCITEMQSSGKYKDVRQAYQIVYQQLKLMARKSSQHGCNVIFTSWADNMEVPVAGGEKVMRTSPKLPQKILDNICGLVNVVAYITTSGEGDAKKWYYVLEGGSQLYAKDQLYCRKSCYPKDIFSAPKTHIAPKGDNK